jgi:peptide/nickel transport system substrate-binding protein
MPGNQLSTENAGTFQYQMYRPLYFWGNGDKIALDDDMSIGNAPTWSSDGLTVTVPLKDYSWSNGEKVTGQDVAFWVNMAKAEEANYGYYTPPNTATGTKYFPDDVTAVQASDTSFSLTLDKPANQTWFLDNMLSQITPMPLAWDVSDSKGTKSTCATSAFGSDAAQKACDADYKYLNDAGSKVAEFATNPLWKIVDGPFTLKDFNATSGAYSIVANKSFSGTHKPYLDEVDFVAYTSSDAEYTDLKAGSSGANALQIGYLPKVDAPQYNKNDIQAGNPLASAGYSVAPLTYLDSISYYQINFGNPTIGKLFKQPYFVQALQDTYDQQGIIDKVLKGWGYPTTGGVPSIPDGNPLSPQAKANKISFDPAAAKTLLTNNGWDTSTTPATCKSPGTGAGQCGDGIAAGTKAEFKLDYPSGRTSLDTSMAAYKSDAAKASISIDTVSKTQNTIGTEVSPCSTSNPSGCQWEAALYGGWVYAPDYYPTGDGLWATGAGANTFSFSDPKMDTLIAKSVTSSDINDMYAYEDYLNTHQPVVFNENGVLIQEVAKGFYMPAQDPYQGYEPEFWYFTQ